MKSLIKYIFPIGVLQLLQTRTSRRFLQSRLTPDMERKLVFLTSQVRFGYHKRYQEWFQRQVREKNSLDQESFKMFSFRNENHMYFMLVFSNMQKTWLLTLLQFFGTTDVKGLDQISVWVQALSVPIHLGLWTGPLWPKILCQFKGALFLY